MVRPLDLLGRAKQYFTRGHQTIGLTLTLMNTLGIWFGLIPGIRGFFGDDFLLFALIFIPIYGVTMVLFGYWDMKKGLYKSESITQLRRNPHYQLNLYLFSQILWDNAKILRRIVRYMEDPDMIKEMQERIQQLEKQGNSIME